MKPCGARPNRASPAHACLVVTAARRHGKAIVGVQFSEQAPCGCGATAAHHLAKVRVRVRFPVSAPCDRSVSGSTRPSQGCSAGPNPVGHSRCRSSPIGRGARPSTGRFRVRISGTARSEAGRSRLHRSARTGRLACPRPPLHGALAQRLLQRPAMAYTFGCEGPSPSCSSHGR